MNKFSKVNIIRENPKQIWQLVLFTSALSFLAYLYIIGSITFNVIERKNLENEAKNLNSRLSQLELNYLSLDREINLELARGLGFSENPNTFFASRNALVVNQNASFTKN